MPHDEMTAEEAVDSWAESTREVGACQAMVARIPGREAQRVSRTLEFEALQMNSALSVIRKAARAWALDQALLAACREKFGEDAVKSLLTEIRSVPAPRMDRELQQAEIAD